MDDGPIRHVSDTADWIAVYRAVETERRDALFRDPFAALLTGEKGRELAAEMGEGRILAWSVALRTVIVDTFIAAAIDDGVDAVLNLGAGLDARPYRLELPADLLWVEADFPQVIEAKTGKLAGHEPRCRLERVALDLTQAEERRRLFADLNARVGRVLVISEGVVSYLSTEEAGGLAADLAAQPSFTLWITDYFSPLFMQHYRKGRMHRPLGRNAPFRVDPGDWEDFYASHGWGLREMRYLTVEGRRLRRPSPIALRYRLVLRLLPRAKREVVDYMTGYALLERREEEGEGAPASE